jgi:hypothetical protein
LTGALAGVALAGAAGAAKATCRVQPHCPAGQGRVRATPRLERDSPARAPGRHRALLRCCRQCRQACRLPDPGPAQSVLQQ